MTTWHLHISGQVQGVGFRPFVYRQALQYDLQGWVNNGLDGVHIEFNATERVAQGFYRTILECAPPLAQITRSDLQAVAPSFFDDFRIVHSEESGEAQLLLSPDFALCEACRLELFDAQNRRADYPFTTCTLCGPRYSIVRSLPYDRATTTMAPFTQCPACRQEYEEVLDRRYYSQTNSCPSCAIQLTLYSANGEEVAQGPTNWLEQVVSFWQQGKIIAIKGIGGYLLTCDATQPAAVQQLRQRKHRPTKPFAVMYPDLASLGEDAVVGAEDAQLLAGPVSPICLLRLQPRPKSGIALSAIAPGLDQLGVMLPYTPLYALLLQAFQQPIVATSGNLTNAPIVFEDEQAIAELTNIADYVLVNNRDIAVPQDDSVVRFTPAHRQRIILRRSRGWAPTYINPKLQWPQASILAAGADMKSAFGLLHQRNTYLGQYLGDLSNYNTELNYQHTLQHFLGLFRVQPKLVLADQHPAYASTRYASELAEQWAVPQQLIQHHIAHFGAILGEHDLLSTPEPILGVIWDGTGLGNDGQIWGGEFFIYTDFTIERRRHLSYFNFFLGDKMPREPRLSALSLCQEIPEAQPVLQPKFSDQEWRLYTRLLEQEPKLKTSSAGRLFDGVASLLGLADRQHYEGEAAMQLEQLALSYFAEQTRGLEAPMQTYFTGAGLKDVPLDVLIQGVCQDLLAGQPKSFIAARFHFSLVDLIRAVANDLKIQKIACSGGVWQNGLLVDLMIQHLSEDFKLYFHEELSPNDENIAFGQLVCYQIEEYRKQK